MTTSPRDAAERLLPVAEAVLSGQQPMGPTNPTRAACWIGRRALELLVEAWLSEQAVQTGTAKMASKFTCLAWAYREAPTFVEAVQQSWDQLSGGCHQHAYDLAPTHAESVSMIANLRRLSLAASPPDGS